MKSSDVISDTLSNLYLYNNIGWSKKEFKQQRMCVDLDLAQKLKRESEKKV